MRINYGISREAFLAAQAPFVPPSQRTRGGVWFEMISILLCGIGMVLLGHHLLGTRQTDAFSVSAYGKALFLIIAGVSAILLRLAWAKASAKRMRRQYVEILNDRYNKLHCREGRFLEINDDGLSFGCACGETQHPWPQFVSLMENNLAFAIQAMKEIHIVPKGAFADEAARTEFRHFLGGHLDRPDPLAARRVELICSKQDLWWAQWLHIRRGGGWRILIVKAFLAGDVALLLVFFAQVFDESVRPDRLLIAESVALGLLLFLVPLRPGIRYLGPLKVWFSEEGVYLHYPFSEVRLEWYHLFRFLEDKHNLLLYQDNDVFLPLPRRFIAPAQREHILSLLRTKVRPV